MRLPRRIDLGVVVIDVRLVDKKQMREEGECDDEDATPEGMWDHAEDTIFIGRWLSQKRKREILFHELIHAMIDYREMDNYETLT